MFYDYIMWASPRLEGRDPSAGQFFASRDNTSFPSPAPGSLWLSLCSALTLLFLCQFCPLTERRDCGHGMDEIWDAFRLSLSHPALKRLLQASFVLDVSSQCIHWPSGNKGICQQGDRCTSGSGVLPRSGEMYTASASVRVIPRDPEPFAISVLASAKAVISLQCTYAYKDDPEERFLSRYAWPLGYLKGWVGTSLAVQWLRPCTSTAVLVVKNLPANAGDARDTSSIPGLGRYPGRRNGNLLPYSCLENPMDRGAWRATVHRVAESDTAEATEHAHILPMQGLQVWSLVGELKIMHAVWCCQKQGKDEWFFRGQSTFVQWEPERQKVILGGTESSRYHLIINESSQLSREGGSRTQSLWMVWD